MFGEGLCLGLVPKEAAERGITRLGRVRGKEMAAVVAAPRTSSAASRYTSDIEQRDSARGRTAGPLSCDLGLLEGDRCAFDLKVDQQSLEVGAPPRATDPR